MEKALFTRILFGGTAVWKGVVINSLGAKGIPYGHECACWYQDLKRRGWNCSAREREKGLFVPQSRKRRRVPGTEGRPGAV